jgi:hypothetical protein
MKKTRIIKFIKQINFQEYNANIIIPLKPISFSTRSAKHLKEILHELLATQKKILKKKEKEIMEQINSNMKDVVLKRNFNIIINDELIEITSMHEVLDNEEINMENYLKDLINRIKILKISTKITYLIFEYNVTFKFENN